MMVTLEEGNIHPKYLSVFRHTIAQQIHVELEQDYQFPRAICRSLTDLFTSYLDIYFGSQRNPNQIVFIRDQLRFFQEINGVLHKNSLK